MGRYWDMRWGNKRDKVYDAAIERGHMSIILAPKQAPPLCIATSAFSRDNAGGRASNHDRKGDNRGFPTAPNRTSTPKCTHPLSNISPMMVSYTWWVQPNNNSVNHPNSPKVYWACRCVRMSTTTTHTPLPTSFCKIYGERGQCRVVLCISFKQLDMLPWRGRG